jgi:tRNA pseudouridine55 synthase
MMHGFAVIDKPKGMTSHDIVAKLRKHFGTKRVGHAGTLDPMATGVLVVGINNGTKFLSYITNGKKKYLATIQLGTSTVTDDAEGEILYQRSTDEIDDQAIQLILAAMIGEIQQVPSQVSAIKVQGERAYDLVRQGKSVELKARSIKIFELNLLNIRRGEKIEIDIEVYCSSGTYIRSIARDLGEKLGVGGHLTALRRTVVEPFSLEDAHEVLEAKAIPLLEAISKVLPVRTLTLDEIAEIKFGRAISHSVFEGSGVGATAQGEVLAILENRPYGAQPVTVLNP